MEFAIIFYKDESGDSPIEEFLDELERTNSLLYDQTLKGFEKLKNRAYHKEPLSKSSKKHQKVNLQLLEKDLRK